MNCIYAYKIKLGCKYNDFGLGYKVFFRKEKISPISSPVPVLIGRKFIMLIILSCVRGYGDLHCVGENFFHELFLIQ